VQLFVAVDQALVPVEPFQFHARRRQAVEAHAAVHRAHHRVHPRVAEHAAEIGLVIVQFQLVVQQHLQHHVQGLVEQSALDRVFVVLQEGFHLFLRGFKLLQGEIDQQLQFQDRQLAPGRVFVKLDADQGDDVGVIVELAVFQAFQQGFQAGHRRGGAG
jgi:hypothetical protein